MRPRNARYDSGLRMKAEIALGKPMVHRPHPVLARQRRALRIGDRDEWQFAELFVERHQIRQVETAMHRREMRRVHPARERKVQRRDVIVDDVEVLRALRDLLDHQHVRREWIDTTRQALRLLAHRDERRGRAANRRSQRASPHVPDERAHRSNRRRRVRFLRRASVEHFHSAVQLAQSEAFPGAPNA